MTKSINKNDWSSIPLKHVALINNDALSELTDPDLEIRYIDIGDVNSDGEINEPQVYLFADAPSRARRIVRKGDVIVSTVRTYLQAIAAIDYEPNKLIVSTGFAVITPKIELLTADFCKYCLREQSFLAEVEKRSTGVSYPAINASELGNISIKVPAIKIQAKISSYLTGEIAQINGLLKSKKRLIELLSQKRQTLITQAVTRGLNPKAKMKATGIEWLGEVPAHWEVIRSKWLLKERNERSITGEEEMLTVSHITGVTPRSEKTVYMFEAETNEGYKICKKGDLVINTLWAWMGAMGTAPCDGIVSPAYHVYVPHEAIISDYIDAISRLPLFAAEVTKYSKGVWSSRLRLYPEGFYEVYLPVPSVKEQTAICDFILEQTSKMDNLIAVTEKSISLLQERKSALITAVVTGQLEIN